MQLQVNEKLPCVVKYYLILSEEAEVEMIYLKMIGLAYPIW